MVSHLKYSAVRLPGYPLNLASWKTYYISNVDDIFPSKAELPSINADGRWIRLTVQIEYWNMCGTGDTKRCPQIYMVTTNGRNRQRQPAREFDRGELGHARSQPISMNPIFFGYLIRANSATRNSLAQGVHCISNKFQNLNIFYDGVAMLFLA